MRHACNTSGWLGWSCDEQTSSIAYRCVQNNASWPRKTQNCTRCRFCLCIVIIIVVNDCKSDAWLLTTKAPYPPMHGCHMQNVKEMQKQVLHFASHTRHGRFVSEQTNPEGDRREPSPKTRELILLFLFLGYSIPSIPLKKNIFL